MDGSKPAPLLERPVRTGPATLGPPRSEWEPHSRGSGSGREPAFLRSEFGATRVPANQARATRRFIQPRSQADPSTPRHLNEAGNPGPPRSAVVPPSLSSGQLGPPKSPSLSRLLHSGLSTSKGRSPSYGPTGSGGNSSRAPPTSGRKSWPRPRPRGAVRGSTVSEESRRPPCPRQHPGLSCLGLCPKEREAGARPLPSAEPQAPPLLVRHGARSTKLRAPPFPEPGAPPLYVLAARRIGIPVQLPTRAHCARARCLPGSARPTGSGLRSRVDPVKGGGAGACRAGEAWPGQGWTRSCTARRHCSAASCPAGGAEPRAQTMSPEEWTYLVVLLISIPIGFLFKKAGPGLKRWGAAAVGLGLTLFTCGPHTLHSLITVLGTWALIQAHPCSCHALALAWTFSYLLFFRALGLLGLPTPTPFTNAVQLLLTLKLVSLASEVQDLHQAQRKEIALGFRTPPSVGMIPDIPSLLETLSYSYCYVGIMTGPFFRYRTYLDWLEQPFPEAVPSLRPLLRRAWPAPLFGLLFLLSSHLFPLEAVREDAFYARPLPARLFYMIPVFFAFRMRFYVAWIAAECGCIAAGFGAYPVAAKARAGGGPTLQCPPPSSPEKAASLEYDYETIRNIDCYGTDFCVRVRDGMRYWNMTVQWWLAQYIYKSSPFRSYVLRSAWTMLLSAYWHGLHPGYYLSFLTIPLCLAAEGRVESALRGRLGPRGQQAWDWVHWFLKMRAYDYMCMGFVLLSLGDTLRYWASIYYCIHVLAMVVLGLGLALGGGGPSRRKASSLATGPAPAPEKLREE